MKTPNSSKLKGLLVLVGGLAICGCAQNSTALTETLAAEQVVENADTNTVAQPPPPDLDLVQVKAPDRAAIKTSPGVDEVIKLAESGAEDSVIQTFIENSPIAYRLSADEIVYLRDIGISEPIINAMMKHGSTIRERENQILTEDKAAKEKAEQEKRNALATLESQKGAQVDAGNLPPAPPQPTEGEQAPAPPTYAENAQQPPVYTAPLTPPQVNYFYSELSPYGSWYDLPGYGWCWQPTVVALAPSWQPYCHGGQWLYSNCGWYWSSSYSWGWAPFHYGRWWHHPHRGWVWFPDSVWGPAWVTWRTGSDFCGWAPLPPRPFCGTSGIGVSVGFGFGLGPSHFTFVSYKDFAGRHPAAHRLPPRDVNHVFNNTKIVNNIFLGPNKTVINQGVGVEKIAQVSRTEVRRVEVRNAPPAQSGVVHMDRLERQGGSLVVTSQPVQKPTQAPALSASLDRSSFQKTGLPTGTVLGTGPSSTVQPRTETPRRSSTTPIQPVALPAANGSRSTESHSVGVQTTPTIVGKPVAPRMNSSPSTARPQIQSQPQRTITPQGPTPLNRSGAEQGVQASGNRPVYSTPQPVAARPPGFSVPAANAQSRSQPVVVGQPNRQELPAQVYNYPRSQIYYPPQYRTQPTVVQPARPQMNVQAPVQRGAPTYSPAPRPTVSAPQPAAQSRPSAPSAPLGRDK